MFKNNESEEIKGKFVLFDPAYEINDDTGFKVETVDNFPLPFN